MGAGNQQGAHRYWNETRWVLETNEGGNKVGTGKKRVGTGKKRVGTGKDLWSFLQPSLSSSIASHYLSVGHSWKQGLLLEFVSHKSVSVFVGISVLTGIFPRTWDHFRES